MAYAHTQTLIPLDRVAYHLQIDPWHFHSIFAANHPIKASCDDVWFQHDWQFAGRVARESMATALRTAEDVLCEYLNWFPVPRWVEEEEVQLPSHYNIELYNYANARGMKKSLMSRWGYVIETGRRAKTVVALNAVTSFNDDDSDGLDETVTVVVNTTVTEEQELRLYYPGKNADDDYEIRPLTSISINVVLGIATISFPKYLIAKEDLIEKSVDPAAAKLTIDGDNNNNFLQEVDVYRVYTDVSEQVTFHEEEAPCEAPDCTSLDETGCLYIRNSRLGILAYSRANWDATAQNFVPAVFTMPALKATVHYRAGLVDNKQRYPMLQMDESWERMIVFFALTFLDTKLCGCSNTQNIWESQTVDMAQSTKERSFNMPWAIYDNPFGTTKAAINLWKRVHSQNARLSKVVSQL